MSRQYLWILFLATLLCGCASEFSASDPRTESGRTRATSGTPDREDRVGFWTLLPQKDAEPADLSQVTVVGELDSAARLQLARLVGRIDGISHKVFRIETSWPEFVVAAKVYVVGTIVFCVRNADGKWRIALIAEVNV